jgi:VCBS repeat-containing protein
VFGLGALVPRCTAAETPPPPAAEQAPADESDADAETQKAFADAVRYLRFGVGFEGYYEYNANEPFDRVNQLRAYDTRANTFGIQQTSLVIESVTDVEKGRRFGARVDLQWGQATETVQGSTANEPRPDVYRNLWQAFGTYVFPVGRGLQLDFGKFASMLGFETNYAKDNSHFSRSYLFNFLPFYHSGLRTTLPVHDRVTLMYMLTNGIQQTEEFNNFKSHHLAAVLKPADSVAWTVNYYFGREQPDGFDGNGPDGYFRVADTYVSWTATPKWSFGFDVNHTTNEQFDSGPELSLDGLAAYARWQATSPVALSLRYERLDDEGLFAGIEQVLEEATATAEYKFGDGFLARLELRRDWSDQPFFNQEEQADGLTDDQDTALFGLVWWFGNKKGAW